MSTIYQIYIKPYNPGGAISAVQQAYRNIFKNSPGRKFFEVFVGSSGKPYSLVVRAPDEATPAQADDYLTELTKFITGADQYPIVIDTIDAMPEPLMGMDSPNKFAFQGGNASQYFPGAGPDGWATTSPVAGSYMFYREPSIDLNGQNGKIGTITNLDADLFRIFTGRNYSDFVYATPPTELLRAELDDQGLPGFQPAGDDLIPGNSDEEDSSSYNSIPHGRILSGNMLNMYLLFNGGKTADFLANGTGTKTYDFTNGTFNIGTNHPLGKIELKDKAFRFRANGHWYVMRVHGNQKAAESCYNNDGSSLLWGFEHTHSSAGRSGSFDNDYAYRGNHFRAPDFLFCAGWFTMRQAIRQGENNTGPLVDPVTGLDDVNGVPSTYVSSYKRSDASGPWKYQCSYQNLAEKDVGLL